MPDSDKNITPGPDKGDTLANLSEMISSAKKKKEQESQAKAPVKAPSVNEKKASGKPDISFGPSAEKPAAAVKKTSEPAAPKPAVPKPSSDKISSIADKVAAAADKAVQTDPVRPAQAARQAAPKPAQDTPKPASNGAPARPGQPPKRPGPPPKRRPPQRPPQAAGAAPAAGKPVPQSKPAAEAAKPQTDGAKLGARPLQGKPADKAPAQAAKKPAPAGKKPVQTAKPAGGADSDREQRRKAALERFDREFGNNSPKSKPAHAPKKPEEKAFDKKSDIQFGSNTPEPAESGERKSRFGKKKVKTVIGLVSGLFLLLTLAVVLILDHYLGLFDRNIKKWNNSEAPTYSDVDFSRPDTMDTVTADEKLKELRGKAEMISNKDVMNILLIGEDLRDTATEDAGNTDVMMIISVNKKDRTITETSIMRDCYVYFPDYGYSNRINAAYWHGGIELTQKTIEDYLGLKIDRYVLVNFKVFIDIVDTLGGLDLTVTDEEANGYPGADPNGDNTRGMQNPLDEQNKYLGNKKGTDYIKKGGDLHLNGNQALAYARLRHVGNSDYDRTARQRKVIKEMIKKSKKLSIIEMDKLANKIFPQIKTDVTEGEMAELLIEMLEHRKYKVQEFRVPMDDTYANQVVNGMDVLDVDFWTNSEMLKKKVYGSLAEEEQAADTGVDGVAIE